LVISLGTLPRGQIQLSSAKQFRWTARMFRAGFFGDEATAAGGGFVRRYEMAVTLEAQ